MANFKPILFSTEMVQAISEGRKTQTRRVVKGKPLKWLQPQIFTPDYVANAENGLCPFGQVGDVLWVRENFHAADNYNAWGIWQLIKCQVEIYYNANLTNYEIPQLLHRGKTRPSIFMPKEVCRIFLKIKNIKVERLIDISESDAIAEGIPAGSALIKINFFALWRDINGGESLASNPWVWVIEFEQIDKPKNFC